MIIKISTIETIGNNHYDLIKILAQNGKPPSAENPVDEQYEIGSIFFPEPQSREVGIISGSPMATVALVACKYKNLYKSITIHVPRLGGALVIQTTTSNHPIGELIQM